MLKPAQLCPTLPAREPRGPPGPGSEPPHPGASPLQFPRRRKQQQKKGARRRAPSSGHSPGSRGYGKRSGQKTQRLHKCRPNLHLIHPHSRTHMHRSEKLPGCAKEEGKHRGSGWGSCRSFSHRRCRRHRFFTTRVPATPTAATAGATAGAGATAAASSSTGLEMGGVGRKEEGGRGSGEID